MKSTGLFGKNSGRIGGVVYSNYRGVSVVRTYQPQVKNPNTLGQISQRAKFKLVSQIAKVLGDEISMSYKSSTPTQTPRNSWISDMLRKSVYLNSEASLPIEDLTLTNESSGFISAYQEENTTVNGEITVTYASVIPLLNVKLRVTLVAYNEGGTLVNFGTREIALAEDPNRADTYVYTIQLTNAALFPILQTQSSRFTNYRVMLYAYGMREEVQQSYDEYNVVAEEGKLENIPSSVRKMLDFSDTLNIGLVQNV